MTEPNPPSRKPFHNRWHDQDFKLSELVNAIEDMFPESRFLFSLLLSMLCKELVRSVGDTEVFTKLDWKTIQNLIKSKQSRRWYDQDPDLHRAFNLLYTLDTQQQRLIASMLYMPSRLTRYYEEHCQTHQKEIDIDYVCHMVEVCFRDGPEQAQKAFSHYEG